jgi:hypothetical protein
MVKRSWQPPHIRFSFLFFLSNALAESAIVTKAVTVRGAANPT